MSGPMTFMELANLTTSRALIAFDAANEIREITMVVGRVAAHVGSGSLRPEANRETAQEALAALDDLRVYINVFLATLELLVSQWPVPTDAPTPASPQQPQPSSEPGSEP